MHFWIDKRSQGCGFNRRHLVPPSLYGYGRNHRLFASSCSSSSGSGSSYNHTNGCTFYLKPMVTPVHRFQSVSGRYSTRCPTTTTTIRPTFTHNHNNVTTTNTRSLEMITATNHNNNNNNNNSQIPRNVQNSSDTPPVSKIKCSVWAFFVILTFFLACAKYYFHGVNIGSEAFAFCSLIVIILVIGGLVSLYEIVKRTPYSTTSAPSTPVPSVMNEQTESVELHQQDRPNRYQQIQPDGGGGGGDGSETLPPPPYHIAIMLPSAQIGRNNQTIRDPSPPPSYDKIAN